MYTNRLVWTVGFMTFIIQINSPSMRHIITQIEWSQSVKFSCRSCAREQQTRQYRGGLGIIQVGYYPQVAAAMLQTIDWVRADV